jgi:RNA polymerase sigma-70 factor, ECF subfamily
MMSYSSISIEELIRQCSGSRTPQAWEEFVRRFHRLIATVILRTASRLGDASKQTVDDLIQETYLKLCADDFRILRTFEQQHRTPLPAT